MIKKLVLLWLAGISFSAAAFDNFVIDNIRVEGLRRIELGTVLTHVSLRVGDDMTEERSEQLISTLFSTGFFQDVKLEKDNRTLVIRVEERPAIADIRLEGMKDIPKDTLLKYLKDIGIAPARIFDKNVLTRAAQELKRQYIGRGKYSAKVNVTVNPIDRHRVSLFFEIDEGETVKIDRISFTGNFSYNDDELRDLMGLSTPGFFTWFTQRDRYSREKLQADLESIRSFYLNKGYVDFSVLSTQVSLTPDKKSVYLSIALSEGKKFSIGAVNVVSKSDVVKPDFADSIKLNQGDVYSREKVTAGIAAINQRLGNEGYAFANAVPQLEPNRDTGIVNLTLVVDPGPRVMVRRINIVGNTTTRDEAIRRELRQMESAMYAGEKVRRSRQRVDQTGFFSEVAVDNIPVPGTIDQMDLQVRVTEKPANSLQIGAGWSSAEGVTINFGLTSQNFLGSGNNLSFQFNNTQVNTVYAFSYTNPYLTPDGVSLSYDAYYRVTDTSYLSVGPYKVVTVGTGARFGLPILEFDTIYLGLSVEQMQVSLFNNSPASYQNFVSSYGSNPVNLMSNVSWVKDKRDSSFYPTSGRYQRAAAEIGTPLGDLRYVRGIYQHQYFYPFENSFVLMNNTELGAVGTYNGQTVPFFKNFYLGGMGSIRGFRSSSIGPVDASGNILGGQSRAVNNTEMFVPIPGLIKERSVRLSGFVDNGQLWGINGVDSTTEGFRSSYGIAFNWFSPIGPLRFSWARPLASGDNDKMEVFQFTFGGVF